jgi:hydrogenase maturation protease
MSGSERIIVLGIGNPLKKDEGVGVRVAEELMRNYQFPSNVVVEDAGTMGMSLMPLFDDYDFMLVADAVDNTGYEPGTVVLMTPDELAPNQVLHSLHDIRFVDVIQTAAFIGYEIEVRFVGVQIEDMSPDEAVIGLTPAVEAAVPRAVEAVLELLAERGAVAEMRTEADFTGDMLRALRLGQPMPQAPERLED